ncbi:MAG TPA: hypothetical protein VNS81_01690 [Nocardioides sp.]|nr:hypothetical protein [Nocardioides sp.]
MLRATPDRTASPLSRRRRGVAASLTALVASAALALAGCSSGDDDSSEKGGSANHRATAEAPTNAKLGKVEGPLKRARAERVSVAVTGVVEDWLDGAYGGSYPRTDFGSAFADFTKGARALASKQPGIMSNARVGSRVTGADFAQRVVRVDVVGPKGKPAGATARFRATVELAGLDRTDEVAGRLMLTPTKGGWKVFGFDVRRDEGVS